MKEKKTKEQKREEREARRAEWRRKDIERHTVPCPHCGKGVLDHMTKCPFCKGTLTPSGYRAPDEKKKKTAKIVCYTVFIAIAVVVVILIVVLKK